MIGTPLPALDSGKRDPNEYKPVWQQEVRDEQGRRRFHGAFTGGFSAGYFNSVGSKEGWTPSNFYSSRKDRGRRSSEDDLHRDEHGDAAQQSSSKGKVQGYRMSRPEDFMDEEDLADLRQGRGKMQSSDAYRMQQEPAPRDPLLDMLGLQNDGGASARPESAPASTYTAASIQINPTSLGVMVLQRMGWKPGQGLGPRVTWRRRRQLLELVGTLSLDEPGGDLRHADTDEEAHTHLFPPPDTELVKPAVRDGRLGLGWTREAAPVTLAEALHRAHKTDRTAQASYSQGSGRVGSGFGISALENDSDGEDEVYATGTSIHDSSLAKSQDRQSSQWSTSKDKVRLDSSTNSRRKILKDDKTDRENVWRDGRPMIAGFKLAQSPVDNESWFPAPDVPKGWEPDPHRVWASVTRGADDSSRQTPFASSQLGPQDRASILGEASMPGPPPSILDYLTAKDKERIERMKTEHSEKASRSSQPTSESTPPKLLPREAPKLDPAVAKAALRGYAPFGDDSKKQQRYRAYLQSQAEPKNETPLQPAPGQALDQFHNELVEFSKSAAIFKPMNVTMASRFESSAAGSSEAKPMQPGLYRPEQKSRSKSAEDQQKAADRDDQRRAEEARRAREMEDLPPERRNARLGNFGPNTTRTVKSWKPARLLCKRFNVPLPYQEGPNEGQEQREEGDSSVYDDVGESKAMAMEAPSVKARWEVGKRQLQQLAATRAWEAHEGSGERGDSISPGPLGSSSNDVAGLSHGNDDFTGGRATAASSTPQNLADVGLGEGGNGGEETTYIKPPLDLFKAIFADDESDDSEDEDAGEARKVSAIADIPKADGESDSQSKKTLTPTNAYADGRQAPRPVFVPRKRALGASDEGSMKGSPQPSSSVSHPDTNSRSSKKKRKDKNKKSHGLLTFSMDDGDGDESEGVANAGVQPRKANAAPRADLQPSSDARTGAGPAKDDKGLGHAAEDTRSVKARPRAADLF